MTNKQLLKWYTGEVIGYLAVITPLVIVGHFVVKFW